MSVEVLFAFEGEFKEAEVVGEDEALLDGGVGAFPDPVFVAAGDGAFVPAVDLADANHGAEDAGCGAVVVHGDQYTDSRRE